jgi:hypothetical protein
MDQRKSKKFLIKMKVVCVRDVVKTSDLTTGKVYDSYSEDELGERILIVNDKGVKEWYNSRLFIPLDKWRELQLNELGIV